MKFGNSILGEKKYRGADGYAAPVVNYNDITDINASIASVTESLANATEMYNQAMAAIAACNNDSSGCLSKTGRHINTWRNQRDAYRGLVAQYKTDLEELLVLQEQLSTVQVASAENTQAVVTTAAETTQVAAAAQTAIANADSATTSANFKKIALYGGGALVLIVLGFVVFKQLKKKK
jgi:hypothetical protein